MDKEYFNITADILNHDQLSMQCKKHGGFLPEPRSARENDAVSKLTPKGCHVLLGMTDRHNEGTWLWDSDHTKVIWTKWAKWTNPASSNEPNGHRSQNCALLMNYYEPNDVIGSNVGIWGDVQCDVNLMVPCGQIVCQKQRESLE